MKSKVRSHLSSGICSVILHDTFFSLSPSFSLLSPFLAGKLCRCYINSGSTILKKRKKREQKARRIVGKWNLEPVSSEMSKNSSSSDLREEGQKRRGKLEAEWRQLSSSHPKSLEERQGGKTKNKAFNGSAASRSPAQTPVEPTRSLLIQKRELSFGLLSAWHVFLLKRYFLW